MANAFLPDAARGTALAAALHERLAGSLTHLAQACAPHVALDEPAIAAQIARIAAAPRPRPEIFALHFEILGAAQRSDLPALAAGFADLCAIAPAASPGLALRGWGEADIAPGEAARLYRIFGEADDTPIAFGPPRPAILAEARAALGAALSVLDRSAPALHGEINALICDILLAEDTGAGTTRFDGATAFHAQGALLLNATELRTAPTALATLVHEAAHALLFAATEGAPLAENDPADRFASPLRRDPRPMGGICHAAFVSARMVHALDTVAAAFAAEDRAEAAGLRNAAWRAHAAASTVIRAHARLTPAGATFLDAAARHMAAAAPG